MLTKSQKDLLNKFAESQPALQVAGSPAASSSLKLGDLIESMDDYTAATPASWAGAAPTTLAGAIDRIAAALTALDSPVA